jgi:hypothetical protein
MEPLERECHERFCWSPISVRQSMCVEIEISKPSAPKGQQNSAQGFNPGLLVLTRCALKASSTPRTRGAILNSRSTPTLQYSITPRGRIRGRGRRRRRERSASRVAPECDYPAHCYTRWTDCLPVWCLFQGTRPFNLEPRVKTLGLVLLPLRGRNPKASDGIIALSSMSSCRNIQLVSRRSFP